MELEAKFRVPDRATLERLVAVPRLDGYDLGPPRARHDEDVFLDTADGRLLAAGYYLRRRRNADGLRITLKELATGTRDGLLRREEHELCAGAELLPSDWPEGPLKQRLTRIVGEADLRPILALAQERRTRAVSLEGRLVAELSLDIVIVDAEAHAGRWYEAEVEATEDAPGGELVRLATALREAWGLSPESRAKFTHALALSAEAAP
ncbi:MAG TPA: CYTH domain-containing protein [Thermoleophilia bacterium]|nr:CYTH domain-containing protein [Thermoleophilia bacterium]